MLGGNSRSNNLRIFLSPASVRLIHGTDPARLRSARIRAWIDTGCPVVSQSVHVAVGPDYGGDVGGIPQPKNCEQTSNCSRMPPEWRERSFVRLAGSFSCPQSFQLA